MGTHIPLLLEKDEHGKDILMGHISKGNGQKRALQDGAKVLAIFPGPHAYISPRWYTEMMVPTWNYIAVHIYGTIRLVEGEALRAAVTRLMNNYEGGMPHPVKAEEVPEKTFNDDLRGIIGFSVEIEEIQAAYKMSQNRDEVSHGNIVRELKNGDDISKAVAEEMAKKTNFGA